MGPPLPRHVKLLPLTKIIHHHSSLTTLIRDVVVLTLFSQFIVACYRVKAFPSHTSWKERKYPVKNEMIKLHNDSVKLTVADIETAELNIARYVQRSTYGVVHRKLSTDAKQYDQVVNKIKNSLIKQEIRGLFNLCSFLILTVSFT